jgi:hypothetical protein
MSFTDRDSVLTKDETDEIRELWYQVASMTDMVMTASQDVQSKSRAANILEWCYLLAGSDNAVLHETIIKVGRDMRRHGCDEVFEKMYAILTAAQVRNDVKAAT